MNTGAGLMPVSLRVYSPVQVVLVSAALYAIIFLTSPVSFTDVGTFYSVAVFSGFFFCLLGGLIVGCGRMVSKNTQIWINPARIDLLKRVLLVLGGLGMVARLYDRLFLRAAAAVTGDFAANRELLAQGSGSGTLSMIGALLSPLLFFLPVAVFLSRASGQSRKSNGVFLAGAAVYSLFDAVYFGSRSAMLILIAMTIVAYATIGANRIRPATIGFAIAGLIAFVWVSGSIGLARVTQMGLDPVESLYSSAGAYMVRINPHVLDVLDSGQMTGLKGLLFAYLTFCQYTLHGMFEFLYGVDNFAHLHHSGGLQTFYIPSKVVWAFLRLPGSIEDEIYQSTVRSGVYTTFFGPLFYDYDALGGLVACAIIGFLMGRIGRWLANGSMHMIMPYVLVTALLPFTLIVNLFTGGTGQCLLIDAILLALILKIPRFRLTPRA